MKKLLRCTFRMSAVWRRDRAGVVAERRLVRRADFAQPRAARLENLRDAEAAADLHQLAARDDDLGRRRPAEVPQDQHQCRGVVVDDRGGLGAAENREGVLEIRRAAAARAAGEAVFEVVVVRPDRRQRAMHVGPSGARPKLVWTRIPVPLMTG